jgi:hypothetical protein
MYEASDSLRAAHKYLGLPPPAPAPPAHDPSNEPAPGPPGPVVEVQLIHKSDYDRMQAERQAAQAAQAAQAEQDAIALAERVAEVVPAAVLDVAARPKQRKRPRRSRAKPDARDYHERNCSICGHPDRDAIEEEFLHWHDPGVIGIDYGVGWRSLYRHAHARGLFAIRERNMRFALGHIIEQSSRLVPTGDTVLRAIRAYSCINRKGQWVDPPARLAVSPPSRPLLPAKLPARRPRKPVNARRTKRRATR